jgi:hypothetical protein
VSEQVLCTTWYLANAQRTNSSAWISSNGAPISLRSASIWPWPPVVTAAEGSLEGKEPLGSPPKLAPCDLHALSSVEPFAPSRSSFETVVFPDRFDGVVRLDLRPCRDRLMRSCYFSWAASCGSSTATSSPRRGSTHSLSNAARESAPSSSLATDRRRRRRSVSPPRRIPKTWTRRVPGLLRDCGDSRCVSKPAGVVSRPSPYPRRSS